MATCAGLILLAETVDGTGDLDNLNPAAAKKRLQVKGLGTMPITVRRNAYGRQLGSFRAYGSFGEMDNVPMTFIRAPFITEVRKGCNVLATCKGNIVAVQYGKQLGMAFHPRTVPLFVTSKINATHKCKSLPLRATKAQSGRLYYYLRISRIS